jgi:5-methylcytosine-specific restriction endonuclease McrA
MHSDPIQLEAVLDAYEAGVKDCFRADPSECPYKSGSVLAQEWLLGLNHPNNRIASNSRLRSMRLRLAQLKGRHTTKQWKALCEEFDYRCVRCGASGQKLERDHIVPIYQKGSDGIENIQPLCKECNCSKSSESINWVELRRERGFVKITIAD